MKIDNSRYSAFWSNPELYRLTFEKNIVPRIVPYYFGRGIQLHELAEHRNKMAAAKLLRTEEQQISDKSRKVAGALFEAFKRRWDGDATIQLLHDEGRPLVEVEFDLPIPGSTHSIIGRMDEIVEYKAEPWIGDIKTANAKATEPKKRIEFGFSSQPLFYINAARMLGYPVKGMLYRVVTEHTPPKHWLIESKRTEHQLAEALRSIHQTCETILMFRKTFGVDRPWPHMNPYPCNNTDWQGNPSCDYHGICGRPTTDLTEEDLANFTTRIEHLDLLK